MKDSLEERAFISEFNLKKGKLAWVVMTCRLTKRTDKTDNDSQALGNINCFHTIFRFHNEFSSVKNKVINDVKVRKKRVQRFKKKYIFSPYKWNVWQRALEKTILNYVIYKHLISSSLKCQLFLLFSWEVTFIDDKNN